MSDPPRGARAAPGSPDPDQAWRRRPSMQTPRLLLRPFTRADAEPAARLANAREIYANTLIPHHPYRTEHALRWISNQQGAFERREVICFAVTLRGDGRLIGSVGLTFDGAHDRAELGYWIGKPYWGQGYATEAAREVLRYGFAEHRLRRIHASHFTSNAASGRVLEKLGFVREGVLRQHFRRGQVYHDAVILGLLDADFQSAGARAPAGE